MAKEVLTSNYYLTTATDDGNDVVNCMWTCTERHEGRCSVNLAENGDEHYFFLSPNHHHDEG